MAQNEQLRGVPSRCILISLSEMSRKVQFFCSKEPEGLVGEKRISLPFHFLFHHLRFHCPCLACVSGERWALWICVHRGQAGDPGAHTVVNAEQPVA